MRYLGRAWHCTWQRMRVRLLAVEVVKAVLFLFFFFFNVYLFLGQRETEHEWGRGRERGRHRIRNRLQAPSHQPRARRGARTHRLRDRDLAEVGRPTDCATQAPQGCTISYGSDRVPLTSMSLACGSRSRNSW